MFYLLHPKCFQNFWSYSDVCDPFGVDLCTVWEIAIKWHSYRCEYPVFLTLFDKDVVFFPMNSFSIIIKKLMSLLYRLVSLHHLRVNIGDLVFLTPMKFYHPKKQVTRTVYMKENCCKENPEIMYWNNNGSHACWLMVNYGSRQTIFLLTLRGRVQAWGSCVTIKALQTSGIYPRNRVYTTMHSIKTCCSQSEKNYSINKTYQSFSNMIMKQ